MTTIGVFADRPDMPTGMAVVCKNLALGLSMFDVRVIYFARFGQRFGFAREPAIHDCVMNYELINCVTQNTFMLENVYINNVQKMLVGSKVFGSNGNQVRILEKFEREYNGEVITIKGEGLLPFTVTPEHEIKYTNRSRHRADHESPYYIFDSRSFKPSRYLVPKYDFLIFPKMKEVNTETEIDMRTYDVKRRGAGNKKKLPDKIKIDSNLMAITGLYLAEGNPTFSKWNEKTYPKGIIFSYGKHEKNLVKLTINLIKTIWGLESSRSENMTALRVEVCSTHLAEFFIRSFGRGAKNKQIPYYVMLSPRDLVKDFVVHYLYGDGNERNPNRTHEYKSLRFTTTSIAVALQLQQLLSKIDVFAHIERYEPPLKGLILGRLCNLSTRYIVNISGIQISKLGFEVIDRRKMNRIGETKDFFFVPIRQVIKSRYNGKVNNFKTEDNTYQVSNIVVHNCEGGVWRPKTVIEAVEHYGVDVMFSEDDFFSAGGLVRASMRTRKPLHLLAPIDSLPINSVAHRIFKLCRKVYVPNSAFQYVKNGVYLPHGVDASLFHRENVTRDPDLFTFVWVGRDEPRKALGRAILAFQKTCAKADCQMIIHSDWRAETGKATARYLRYKRDLPVVMTQMEANQQFPLRKIYSISDCLVCSSKAGAFEMGITEAMACGTVPLVTDWTFMNELVTGYGYDENKPSGFLIPLADTCGDTVDLADGRKWGIPLGRVWGNISVNALADAMLFCVNNMDVVQQMRCNAVERAKACYDWGKIATRLYKEIIES